MAGFAETYGILGVALNAGVMKTMLPQTKPTIQIKIPSPSAFRRFRTIVNVRRYHVSLPDVEA